MKKLVLVATMFMFVCGGSFFAMAQAPVQKVQSGSIEVVTDTIVKDTTVNQPVQSDTTATSLAK